MENDRSSDRNVVRDFLAQNSGWDDLKDVKFNNSDTPDEMLTVGESAEQSREDKVRVLFEKEYNGDLKGTVGKVLQMLHGSYALGIMCRDYPDMKSKIFGAMQRMPLPGWEPNISYHDSKNR